MILWSYYLGLYGHTGWRLAGQARCLSKIDGIWTITRNSPATSWDVSVYHCHEEWLLLWFRVVLEPLILMHYKGINSRKLQLDFPAGIILAHCLSLSCHCDLEKTVPLDEHPLLADAWTLGFRPFWAAMLHPQRLFWTSNGILCESFWYLNFPFL